MSEIKVNKISPKQSCTQVTLGDSGDTFIIPSGVTLTNNGSATGFGQTFDATVKTADFTADANTGYFVNTTSNEIIVTLPASPSAGDQVTVIDYAGTFDTNACVLGNNGNPIEGVSEGQGTIVDRQALTLTYTDATQGWVVSSAGTGGPITTPTITFDTAAGSLGTIEDDERSSYTLSSAAATSTFGTLSYSIQSGALPGGLSLNGTTAAITGTATAVVSDTVYNFTVRASITATSTTLDRAFSIQVNKPRSYISATGGTVITQGDFKVHVFTGPGTFCVSAVGCASGSNSVDHVIVAGGGSGGNRFGGGGGAGGIRSNYCNTCGTPRCGGVPVSVQGYPVTVGGGGGNSSAFSLTANRGGSGGNGDSGSGSPGGSGGGGAGRFSTSGGSGNQPPVTPPQGNNGAGFPGGGFPFRGLGGGGYGGSGGGKGNSSGGVGGNFTIFGCAPQAPSYGTPGPNPGRYFAGGGGGGGSGDGGPSPGAPGGSGGGGNGGPVGGNGSSGSGNTGGGGGGGPYPPTSGGSGGSGIVIISYRFQN